MPLPPGLRRRLARWIESQTPGRQLSEAPLPGAPSGDDSSTARAAGDDTPGRRSLDMRAVAAFLEPRTPLPPPGEPAVLELVTALVDIPEPLRPATPSALPAGWLVLDIETCGLRSMPLFLVGMLDTGRGEVTQLLASNHAAEPLLLAAAAERLANAAHVVTFNGATFDLPYIADRARYWRLGEPQMPAHVDLLQLMRRQVPDLPSLRLSAIETSVLGLRRVGDVGGSDIPGIYTDFVRAPRVETIAPVLAHNLIDLLVCWAIADLLGVAAGNPA